MKKISAANSVLSGGLTSEVKEISIIVSNQGDHTDSFGVYVDIVPPGGLANPYGCTPIGRIIDTVVVLDTGDNRQTVVKAFPTFSCVDQAGAAGQTYTITAAVDVHADDAGACSVFQIGSLACYNALADDDDDDTDNRATKNAFQVKMP